jgi:hypothetical protein
MRLWKRMALIIAFVPLMASAQFKDLDTAMSNLTRGFGSGDSQAIVAGIGSEDRVNLAFPGLEEKDGFFGRDQAAYLLDGLFNKVKPVGFEQTRTRKNSSQGQYHVDATWTIQPAGGQPEERVLYITLQNKNDRWAIVSVKAANK